MSENDYDIYGDLDDVLIEPLEEVANKKKAIELAKDEENKKVLEEKEKKLSKLQNNNETLKKNMSVLLATARSEIER